MTVSWPVYLFAVMPLQVLVAIYKGVFWLLVQIARAIVALAHVLKRRMSAPPAR